MPTMPANAAGWRIEPPVSVPVAPRQSPAATADAEPPDEPPGTSLVLSNSGNLMRPTFASPPSGGRALTARVRRRHGLTTGPKHEVSFDEPIANSSLLSLPSNTAPSRHSCEVTVDS